MRKAFYRLLILFIGLNLSSLSEAIATHIVGGNMAYEYVGPVAGGKYRYRITFTTYIDCNSPHWGSGFPEPMLQVGVYEGSASPTGNLPLRAILNMPIVDSFPITPPIASNCAIGTNVCIYQIKYQANVDVSLSFQGYHLFYDRCCRVNSILNLNVPGNQGLAFHAYIPPTLVQNSSPIFSDIPIPFLCINDTATVLNTAFDADGDVLVFSFENPYKGFGTQWDPAPNLPSSLSWPIPPVTWKPGFNKNQPFGASGYSFINSATGYTRYMGTATGEYSIAVEIKEYRNGNLIGITRRDMQMLIVNCPINPFPNLSTASGSGQTSYTISEGDSLCFPIVFYDQLGDSLTLTATGPLFNSGSVNPPATITSPVKGDSIVNSLFCWKTACGQAKSSPYVFTVSVKDNGCPNKATNVVYSIQVNAFQGPLSISGPDVICPGGSGVTYSVTNIPGASFNWIISGGTQVSGGTSNSITVNWGSSGIGTVQVNTISKDGCLAGPLSKTVNISGGPVADAGPDTTICSGDTVTLGGLAVIGYTYLWTPSTGLNNPNLAIPKLSITNSTGSIVSHTYIISVSDTGSCIDTDTVIVSVSPLPLIDAGSDQTVCLGNSIQLTASGGNDYLWTPSKGLSSSTVFNPLASPTASTIYILRGTDASGCSNIDSVTISVVSSAPADAGTGVWVCPGDSVQLNGSGGVLFLWSPANGLSSTTTASTMASPSSSTTYSLTVTDAIGCTGTDTVQVVVAEIVPADAGSDKQICFGDTVILGGTPTGPIGSSFSWSPATGLSNPTLSNPVAKPTSTTTYTVTVMNDTCMGQDIVIIDVLPAPFVDAGIDTSICTGGSITLTASGALNYSWSPATGLSTITGANPVASPGVSTTYYVNGTDINGCTNRDSVIIILDPLPVIDAGTDINICEGTSVQLSASGGLSYSWTPTTGLSATTGSNPIAQPTVATTYYVTGTDVKGCTNMDSMRISLIPPPTIDAGSSNTICVGDTLQLNASGGITYVWSPAMGLSNTTGANPLANPAGSITYYVTGTDNNGCTQTDSVRITVNPLPTVDAGDNQSLCIGKSSSLNASGAASYIWTPAEGLSTTTGASPIASPTLSMVYYVIGTDGNSCRNRDSVIITVNQLPVVNAGTDTKICQGDSASLTATGATTYAWMPASTLSNPSENITFAFPTTTTMYYLTGIDDNGCTNIDSVTVTVFTIEAIDTSICMGETIIIRTSVQGAKSYIWLPPSELNDPTISNPVASPTVTTTYTVIATDTSGCVAIGIVTVTVNNNPNADFTLTLKPACDDMIAEFSNNSTGGNSYNWYFGDGNTSSEINPEHTYNYSQSPSVTLIVINAFGCKDTFNLTIPLNDFSSYLQTSQPNVFTPNFDGANDEFKIGLSGEYLGCTNLKIYNRWGTLILETDRYNHSWDGRTTAGEKVPEGTYYYVFTIKNIQLKGFVTLLR